MDAYTAMKNAELVVLIYDPMTREISIEDGAVISVDNAKALFDQALVVDCNPAMTTLCLKEYDMDAVQELYAKRHGDTPISTGRAGLTYERERLNDIIGAARDILAESDTQPYNRFVDQHALDCAFHVLDNVRANIYDERDGMTGRASEG